MPRYALLGATGSTGKAVLNSLLSQQQQPPPLDLELHILVRSKEKLLKQIPSLSETLTTNQPFPIKIFEGNVTDPVNLQKCLEGAEVVFVCVAQNYGTRETSIANDTATILIESLKKLQSQQGPAYKKTTIIQNRSTTLNPALSAHAPSLIHAFVYFCLYYIYSDLERACENYQLAAKEDPQLLDYIFVDAPTLHDDPHRTGYRLISDEKQSDVLGYADLGDAFCEIASRRGELVFLGVGVSATGKVKTDWGTILRYLFFGLRTRVWDLVLGR